MSTADQGSRPRRRARAGTRWPTGSPGRPVTSWTGWPPWPAVRAATRRSRCCCWRSPRSCWPARSWARARTSSCPTTGSPTWAPTRTWTRCGPGLARRLADYDEYAELFDPYSDTGLTAFRLSDDLAAVAADLIHGLQHYEAGRSLEALWWWQYSYVNHWGTHGTAALRALHAVLAHAMLDVSEETSLA